MDDIPTRRPLAENTVKRRRCGHEGCTVRERKTKAPPSMFRW